MSTNTIPPGSRIGLPNKGATRTEYFERDNKNFRWRAVSGITRDVENRGNGAGAGWKALKNILCFGYKPTNDIRHRIWNVCIAVVLLVFTLPVFAVLFVTIALDSGRPVIYKGLRLGKDRKRFYIYKFRTLRPQAKWVTADQVLPSRSALETRAGKILRETRLDELPQLWNVLKGDMNLFGPRPVRPKIAQLNAGRILNYEARFSVRPGLIGHVQTFMPHRASKRLRTYYNQILIKRPACAWKEAIFLILVASVAALKLGTILSRRLALMTRRGRFRELRATHRATPRDVTVYAVNPDQQLMRWGKLQDINDEAFTFQSDIDLPERSYKVILQGSNSTSLKARRAVCHAQITQISYPQNGSAEGLVGERPKGFRYLAKYTPASELQACLIDRHFASKSFISL